VPTNWDQYDRQFEINGSTYRNRLIQKTQNLTAKLSPDSYAYKECVKNGETIYLDVIRVDDANQKIIYTMPEHTTDFVLGDIIAWANRNWVVIAVDADDEIQRRGKMQECNHLFRWQNGTSDICECYGIVSLVGERSSASGKVLNEVDNQRKFLLPYNDDTKKWYKGKRIACETGYNKDGNQILISYELLDVSSVTSDFGDGKYIVAIAQFSEWSQADSLTYLVADYIAPTSGDSASVSGPDKIRAGGSAAVYTFAGTGTPTWSISGSSPYITTVTTGDHTFSVLISGANDSIIGQSFTITAVIGEASYSKTIRVVSIYG